MSQDLFLEERRQEILKRVNEHGRVSINVLSEQLGVSKVTIRSDLNALADRDLVIRTHGGAIPVRRDGYELALTSRKSRQATEKERIGAAAARWIADGDAIFMDSSSTALAIVPHLKAKQQLTVITSSLAVAQELLDAPGVTVVMPGGTLQRDMVSLVGVEGLAWLSRFNIRTGFFGAHGVSLTKGLTDVSAEEAQVKHIFAEMCQQVVVVVDATKWDQVGLATFAQLAEVDAIVTDENAPADLIAQALDLNIDVVLV